jgi:hypothetical protein
VHACILSRTQISELWPQTGADTISLLFGGHYFMCPPTIPSLYQEFDRPPSPGAASGISDPAECPAWE